MAERSLSGDLRTEITRALWRRWLRWRFLLFQRHRHNRLVLEHVAGRPIVVLPEVFNPALFFTSEFLVQYLDQQSLPPGAKVLDIGTGSGIGAIAAARPGLQIVAVDINPAAVRCARINALLNKVETRVDVREGDLWGPVAGEHFDLVLFNPPYFRGEPRDALDRAFRAVDVLERFVAGLPLFLAPAGRALVVLSSDGDTRTFFKACSARAVSVEVAAQRPMINETLTIYRCYVNSL